MPTSGKSTKKICDEALCRYVGCCVCTEVTGNVLLYQILRTFLFVLCGCNNIAHCMEDFICKICKENVLRRCLHAGARIILKLS
jgi:hypothetical protein